MLPLAIIEGPIIAVIAGFFARTGVFSFYIVYAVIILGDILGDTIAYCAGRFGGPVLLNKFSRFFRITEAKREKARVYFDLHRHKALILSKIIHGIGIAGLITAGNLKIHYHKFFFICLCVSLVQSAFFLLVGVLFGHAYVKIGQYFNFFSVGTIVVGVIVALSLFFYFRARKI
jgi:membrane protein DedA with SNARE-associated domain